MIKQSIISFILISLIILSGCSMKQTKEDNLIVNEKNLSDTEKSIEEKIICNEPYVRHGSDCCLDSDKNGICDPDQKVLDNYKLENHICNNLDLDYEIFKYSGCCVTISNVSKFSKELDISKKSNNNVMFLYIDFEIGCTSKSNAIIPGKINVLNLFSNNTNSFVIVDSKVYYKDIEIESSFTDNGNNNQTLVIDSFEKVNPGEVIQYQAKIYVTCK